MPLLVKTYLGDVLVDVMPAAGEADVDEVCQRAADRFGQRSTAAGIPLRHEVRRAPRFTVHVGMSDREVRSRVYAASLRACDNVATIAARLLGVHAVTVRRNRRRDSEALGLARDVSEDDGRCAEAM